MKIQSTLNAIRMRNQRKKINLKSLNKNANDPVELRTRTIVHVFAAARVYFFDYYFSSCFYFLFIKQLVSLFFTRTNTPRCRNVYRRKEKTILARCLQAKKDCQAPTIPLIRCGERRKRFLPTYTRTDRCKCCQCVEC